MATSRHFGSIIAEMELARGELRVDVNLADPSAFTQDAVDALDRAVDEIESREATARAAIGAAMDDPKAQPLQFWEWHDGAFGSSSYVVLDFDVPGPPTDQLLVVKYKRDGSLVAIAWES